MISKSIIIPEKYNQICDLVWDNNGLIAGGFARQIWENKDIGSTDIDIYFSKSSDRKLFEQELENHNYEKKRKNVKHIFNLKSVGTFNNIKNLI